MDTTKYAALFLAESREHLKACNQHLLEWERDPAAPAPVNGLFRAIHTVKGMAATMGYQAPADLAHRAENLLEALRTGRATISPELLQLLFTAVDALSAAVEAAAASGAAPARPELLDSLDRAAAAASPTPRRRAGDRPAATTPGPGVLVSVAVRADAPMRGGRATLALRRAEALGAVSDVRPPAATFERDDFDGRFTFRLASAAPGADIVAAVRGAGDIAEASVGGVEAAVAARFERQVRVDMARLDRLMKQAGELVVARNRLVELSAGLGDPALAAAAEQIARLVTAQQAEIMQARMSPVGEVFERFPRLVRDVARDLGKRVRFETEGDQIELDRAILDEVGEPLVHLIRNALDHGIESPAERALAGKPEEGRLAISASRDQRGVSIRVSDDGRGIDRAAVLEKARREGALDSRSGPLTDDLLLRVLARPGFSTARAVSGVSGRGVGVDAALTRVRALGGTLEVQSEVGRGTAFTLRLPLTLAVVRALLTRVAEERYAVPLAFIGETVEFDPGAVTAVRDREALQVRDRVVPLLDLRSLVHAAGSPPSRRPAVLLEVGERRAALVVDGLLGQQEIVVEPFAAPRGMPGWLGGATILADGAPALILDPATLV